MTGPACSGINATSQCLKVVGMHAIDEHAESKVDMIHDRLFRNVASSACDHSADIMQALLVWLAQVRDAQPSRPDSSHATATFDQALPNPKFLLANSALCSLRCIIPFQSLNWLVAPCLNLP